MIGSGGWARWYGEAMQDSDKAKLVAVAGGTRAPKYAEDFGIALEESVEKLCEREDVDLVVICSPHGLHADHAVIAAERGKHILVEKPMATTVEECDRMIEAAKRHKVKLMVAHSRRYFPLVRRAKELLDAGEIGRIVMMRQLFCHNARGFGERPGHWMSDPKLSVGFFLGYGCHQLDYTIWLVGSRVRAVMAQFGNYWGEGPIEKCGALFLLFENGVYSTMWEFCDMPKELSDWPPFPEFGEVNEIVGERGLMLLRPYQRLEVRKDGGWEKILELPREEADPIRTFLRQEVEDLIEAIVNDTEPPITGEEGKHVVEVICAAYESARTGRAVELA